MLKRRRVESKAAVATTTVTHASKHKSIHEPAPETIALVPVKAHKARASKNTTWLEEAVFGTDVAASLMSTDPANDHAQHTSNGHSVGAGALEEQPQDGFIVDRRPSKLKAFLEKDPIQSTVSDHEDNEEEQDANDNSTTDLARERAAVWEDEDDAMISVDLTEIPRLKKMRDSEKQTVVSGREYEQKLRRQFSKLRSNQRWTAALEAAAKKNADGEEGVTLLLTKTGKLTQKSATLPQAAIDIARVRDLNETARSEAVIEVVQFHPNGQIAMTAGFDKTVRLFQVDGKVNAKIQSVYFPDMPIHSAAFSPDGRHIFASGRRKFFYSYDVEAGAIQKVPSIDGHTEKSLESMIMSPDGSLLAFQGGQGLIMLVSSHTKQWVADLRMNGTLRALSFSRDGKLLYSFGGDGEVYIWDVAQRSCLHKFRDDGCIHGTALAVSPDAAHIACGSDAGVVNLYDLASVTASNTPTPQRVFLNLTTAVNLLGFNHDGQILAMGSRQKKDCFKLAHVGSRTVFANWPTSNTPIHHASSFDFSPHSGYLSIANDRGRSLLYRLNYFDNA